VELAFNVVHGTYGEDGALQADLERLGIPYTGEGVEGSRLAIDKIASKRRFAAAGVPTARFEVIAPGGRPSIPVPCVVKAPREGSSVGVYIVKDPAELAPALEGAAAFGDEILVEEFVPGRELTVGILGDLALPVIEIRPKEGFYDFANKYPFLNPAAAGADHLCPAPLSPGETAAVQDAARRAHAALGLRVYSRVDVLLTPDGQPSVLEINTIPGMTPSSLLPEAAGVAGIAYGELCARIVALSEKARRKP
jgi:D-alanine-D-alanine ligase